MSTSFEAVVESTDPVLQKTAILEVAEVALPLLVQGHFSRAEDMGTFDQQLCFDRPILWNSTLALYFFAKHGGDVLRVLRVLREEVDEAVSYDARNTILRLASRELALFQELVKTLRGPSAVLFASVREDRSLPRDSLLIIQQIQVISLIHIRGLDL
jgi:hypothetical protein